MQSRANWRGLSGGRDALSPQLTQRQGEVTHSNVDASCVMTLLTDVTQVPGATPLPHGCDIRNASVGGVSRRAIAPGKKLQNSAALGQNSA
jgi:hypothetical protein